MLGSRNSETKSIRVRPFAAVLGIVEDMIGLEVHVTTNGCIEGQLSSTYVEEFFRKNGVAVTKDLSQADMVFFWGCGLTEKRERDSLQDIKNIKGRMKPGAKLILWGCLPKINPKALSTVYDGPMLGIDEKAFFEGLVEKINFPFDISAAAGAQNRLVQSETCVEGKQEHADALTDTLILFKQDWERLWQRARKGTTYHIRIASGCTGHCAYCSELCVFGRVKSRPIADVVSELEKGLNQGYNRFSLVATDVGAYGKDIGCTLAALLEELVHTNDKTAYKIVLNQVNAFYLREMFSDLRNVFASGKIDTLNCPVQSGSERILKLMGRPHSAEAWKKDMVAINKEFPSIRLSTHFMVGFPTESDEDFNATLRLLDYPLFLDRIIVFKFSGRPKAYARRIPGQVSAETKELRSRKLLQKYIRSYALYFPIRAIRSFL